MPLFSAKLDYALRAVVDLATQPRDVACQSREIAARQDIRGPYLDQILAILKREGIIRSIRGAGGGYTIARPPASITVLEVIQAVLGNQLLVAESSAPADPNIGSAEYVIRQYEEEIEERVRTLLKSYTIADLVARKQRLEESLVFMPSI